MKGLFIIRLIGSLLFITSTNRTLNGYLYILMNEYFQTIKLYVVSYSINNT